MTDARPYRRAVVMHRLKRAYDSVTCVDARRILLEPLWPVLALVLVAVFGAMTSARAAQSSAAGTADPRTASDGNNTDETVLAEIVVTATRIPQSSFDLPVSVNSVSRRRIQEGQLQVNMSESLDEVPGVSIQSRQNYAQDLQLSVRGFGARSSFGVRGVRLYSDGIPGTMPDGQGQFSQFDLGSADHIEVLRGPFSALYGNSSGGVIAIFTEDGAPVFEGLSIAQYGTFNTQRYALKGSGDAGVVNYVVDAAHFQTDGYRDHSNAERNIFNSKVRFKLDDLSKLTLVANAIETPFVQDPLGLTRAQLAADPRQAGTNAIAYNTRKSLSQEQAGATYERQLAPTDDLSLAVYAGHRDTTQFQAIPKSTEALPRHPGGVIDLGRTYFGADLHVTDHRSISGTPLQITAGVSYDNLDEARRGFLNFVGDEVGVEGALRRHETNHVYDLDEYLQAQWDPSERWRLLAGVRNSIVDVSSINHLAPVGVAVESGVRYSATNPVAGLTYRATDTLNFYASYGKGFETPTLSDLAYRSTDGSLPGLNLALKSARSDNYEIGTKAEGSHWRGTLALFYIQTHDELAVQSNAAGRSVFENIDETQRRGLELGLDAWWKGGFTGRIAYTYIKAEVVSPYETCVTLPCHPTLVPKGNRLPAVPANALYAALTWRYAPVGFSITAETLGRAQIFVDDRNSDAAPGYWVENLRAGFEQDKGVWHFSEYASVNDLTNRRYVGSVIVNETNSRFFEPAPGRTALLMFSAAYRDRAAAP
jgi:iron complex outermembrane recepter protein